MLWKRAETCGWGRALRAEGEIARPERQATLMELVAQTPAPAIGMRRSYGDAALNGGGRVIDMTRLDRLLGFDPETGMLEVEAGVRIGDIVRHFAPKGWLPPVVPGTGFATVGGCIAQDVHGKNHHRVGSFGQHVAALTLLTPGGAQEVTPESELFRATAGGLGQTGVIAAARLRLVPSPGNAVLVSETRVPGWDDFIARLDGSTADYAVGWVDATARGAALGRGILEEGEIAPGPAPEGGRPRRIPFDAPGFALAPPVVRLFNAAYRRRVPAAGRQILRPLGDFFFPLDRIHDWNRLYGRRGFHQFQCVVPVAAATELRAMLEMIAASGLASPLAVLKRMGMGRAGHLSFPMEGYTLAVDFPNRAAARDLIRRLEDRAVAAGGRIYFAKDSLSPGAAIPAMYPELSLWREETARADPKAALMTDLVRRLSLREAP